MQYATRGHHDAKGPNQNVDKDVLLAGSLRFPEPFRLLGHLGLMGEVLLHGAVVITPHSSGRFFWQQILCHTLSASMRHLVLSRPRSKHPAALLASPQASASSHVSQAAKGPPAP